MRDLDWLEQLATSVKSGDKSWTAEFTASCSPDTILALVALAPFGLIALALGVVFSSFLVRL